MCRGIAVCKIEVGWMFMGITKLTYNITNVHIYKTLIGSHGTTTAWWFWCVISFRVFTTDKPKLFLNKTCKIHLRITDVFYFYLDFTDLLKSLSVSRKRRVYGRYEQVSQAPTVHRSSKKYKKSFISKTIKF